MKTVININQKIGMPNFGSFGAGCSFELEIDQAALQSRPDDVLSQIRFAADICRAAVSRELDVTRQAVAAAREPSGSDYDSPGDDVGPGDRGYTERSERSPAERQDDRRPAPRRDADEQPRRDRDDRPRGGSNGRQRERKNWRDGGKPTTGAQLWGFAKDFGTVKWFADLGESWGFAEQFRDWTESEVADATEEFFKKRPDKREHAGRNGRS